MNRGLRVYFFCFTNDIELDRLCLLKKGELGMQLFLLDTDIHYRDQFIEVLMLCESQKITIQTLTNLEELIKLNFDIREPVMLLVDIECVTGEAFYAWWLKSKIPFSILCEEFVSIEDIDLFKNDEFKDGEVSKFFLNRFQEVNCLLDNIKDNYLSQGNYTHILKNTMTSVVSFFSPYGDINFSSKIENQLLKSESVSVPTLIIHYDPFYRINERTRFNLSYVFSQIKRKEKDISWIIEGVVRKISPNIHCLDGPLHMSDIDYLNDVMLEQYTHWLLTESKYHRIILNFNGVHISKHVDKLLSISTQCALLSMNEAIQMLVLKQFHYKWHLHSGDIENIVKEMIL